MKVGSEFFSAEPNPDPMIAIRILTPECWEICSVENNRKKKGKKKGKRNHIFRKLHSTK